jgi:endonuclease/exonuclease/phosphatase family metal-dependent hydrolase
MRRLVAIMGALAATTAGSLGLVTTLGTVAAASAAPAAAHAKPPPSDVRIVDINLLHGAFCDDDSGCQAPDRVALLFRQLTAAGCPQVVGLQEININLATIINKGLPKLCGGKYHVAFAAKPASLDTERVLTTLPVTSEKVVKLPGAFRTASRVVLKSALGPISLVVTHQDGDPETANPVTTCRTCKPPCTAATPGPFQCQTDTAAWLADQAGGPKAIRVLMGDFNVTPASARYQSVVGAGWTDSYLAAGNPECDPATGIGCTSGRDDKTIATLKDPNAKESERIDFIFVKPPKTCAARFDPASDSDHHKLGTGLFNATPAVNGPGGLVWPSDHTGVSADLACATTKG